MSKNVFVLRSMALAAMLLTSAVATLPAQAAAPAYTWNNVKIGGSGYVTGMIAHPRQRGLFYSRTDVGGAYRYDATTSTWIPLTDWLAPNKGNYYGIDAFAIDQNNANKLYMVLGANYGHTPEDRANLLAMFLSSQDQGRTFKQVLLPFSAGANEKGRQVGERLQVDPNLGTVLFYGTGNAVVNATENGLWKSTNSGDTWSKVSGFPALSSDGKGAGVPFLAFYTKSGQANAATPVIYAAINTQAAADTGATLYKSVNGGATWTRVPGAPVGMLPQRGQIGPDGFLYITFGHYAYEYGPEGINNGQVWKVNVQSGGDQWTNITPTSNAWYAFVGLSVDPTHPGMLVVNTQNNYSGLNNSIENAYRSVDGGATWTDVYANSTLDTSAVPWSTPTDGRPPFFGNWGGSLIDPFDPDHGFISFSGGIWESKNLTQPRMNWAYAVKGIEESAPLSLISPIANEWNAYPLISGIGDVCGFIHTDVTVAPLKTFTDPVCMNTESLDYARNNSKIVVRVGVDPADNRPRHFGAISWNGGYSWNAFGSNGPSVDGGGRVALSGDGSTILWSNNAAPTVVSQNAGASWTQVEVPQGSMITADGADPGTFYTFENQSGKFYASYNKGVSWYLLTSGGANGLPAWGDALSVPFGKKGGIWASVFDGLYHNTNWGQGAWTKMPAVQAAKGLGFGKAAPGAAYPAMYLDGTINGVTGVYRSIDTGASWVRIDSAQGQYAHAGYDRSAITGDPKVFGTVYINKRGIMVGTSSN